MPKPKLTAEQGFLQLWEEHGWKGSDIVREYKFHSERRWRFDFAWPSRKVAVEIDGRGRHQTVVGTRNDCEKHNTACLLGWVVLHIPATDVFSKDESGERRLVPYIEMLRTILFDRSEH